MAREVLSDGDWIWQMLINLLRKALNLWGFETAFAANGLEALETLKENMYDMVISDIQMPVLDGVELCRCFREWEYQNRPQSSTPVRQIMMATSANCEREDLKLCVNAGFDAFIPKPISLSVLKPTIRTYLGDGRFRSELQDFSHTPRAFRIYDMQGHSKDVIVPSTDVDTRQESAAIT